jgi:hypothetical protein
MLNWLYNISDIGIGLLFGFLGAGALASAPLLREKLMRIRISGDHSEAARDALGLVTGFTGAVLAFSLVQAQGNLRNLEMRVGTEAHDLAQLDRWLVWYGDPTNDGIRASLREYADSIVSDEWPELRKGAASERTAALFIPVSRGILAMQPTPRLGSVIFGETLKTADALASDRAERVDAAAHVKLPRIFWETIVALLVVLVLLATRVEATRGRAVALGAQGFALALLVALVFIFDQPFKGQTAVSPEPIAEVLAKMQASVTP